MRASDVTVIFETVHGSRAYGLATESSDTDLRGVFVPPPLAFTGYLASADQIELSADRVLYEVRKFFRLAAVSNPTVIEVLFTDSVDHVTVSPEGSDSSTGDASSCHGSPGTASASTASPNYGGSRPIDDGCSHRPRGSRSGATTASRSARPFRQTSGGLPRRCSGTGAWRKRICRPASSTYSIESVVKGLLYAYRSALTGIYLLRTSECVGDVISLAPYYGFSRVGGLVARKAEGSEHAELAATTEFDADLDRLEIALEAARLESPLPPEAPNTEALDEFLIRVRRTRFS